MRTIAVDFDGVIHQYSRGWADGTIYDPPIAGAIEGLRSLMKNYAVFVHTTRDPKQVSEWLNYQGIPTELYIHDDAHTFWYGQDSILVTNFKLPAIAYIDDRAYFFTGWGKVVEDFGVVPEDDEELDGL